MWTTAVADLRVQLSDQPDDRYNSQKQCFGQVDGSNLTFRTFEFRRVTDFTTAAAPLGVYLNGVRLDPSAIVVDYVNTGEFMLAASAAPTGGQVVDASYYTQWFLDSELETFLVIASRWLDSGSDYTQTPGGLIPAVIKYACGEAYDKMAQKWRTWQSEMYRVEDEPKKPGTGPVESFIKMAQEFHEQAETLRKTYYTRQDRNLQPLFGQVIGNVRQMP